MQNFRLGTVAIDFKVLLPILEQELGKAVKMADKSAKDIAGTIAKAMNVQVQDKTTKAEKDKLQKTATLLDRLRQQAEKPITYKIGVEFDDAGAIAKLKVLADTKKNLTLAATKTLSQALTESVKQAVLADEKIVESVKKRNKKVEALQVESAGKQKVAFQEITSAVQDAVHAIEQAGMKMTPVVDNMGRLNTQVLNLTNSERKLLEVSAKVSEANKQWQNVKFFDAADIAPFLAKVREVRNEMNQLTHSTLGTRLIRNYTDKLTSHVNNRLTGGGDPVQVRKDALKVMAELRMSLDGTETAAIAIVDKTVRKLGSELGKAYKAQIESGDKEVTAWMLRQAQERARNEEAGYRHRQGLREKDLANHKRILAEEEQADKQARERQQAADQAELRQFTFRVQHRTQLQKAADRAQAELTKAREQRDAAKARRDADDDKMMDTLERQEQVRQNRTRDVAVIQHRAVMNTVRQQERAADPNRNLTPADVTEQGNRDRRARSLLSTQEHASWMERFRMAGRQEDRNYQARLRSMSERGDSYEPNQTLADVQARVRTAQGINNPQEIEEVKTQARRVIVTRVALKKEEAEVLKKLNFEIRKIESETQAAIDKGANKILAYAQQRERIEGLADKLPYKSANEENDYWHSTIDMAGRKAYSNQVKAGAAEIKALQADEKAGLDAMIRKYHQEAEEKVVTTKQKTVAYAEELHQLEALKAVMSFMGKDSPDLDKAIDKARLNQLRSLRGEIEANGKVEQESIEATIRMHRRQAEEEISHGKARSAALADEEHHLRVIRDLMHGMGKEAPEALDAAISRAGTGSRNAATAESKGDAAGRLKRIRQEIQKIDNEVSHLVAEETPKVDALIDKLFQLHSLKKEIPDGDNDAHLAVDTAIAKATTAHRAALAEEQRTAGKAVSHNLDMEILSWKEWAAAQVRAGADVRHVYQQVRTEFKRLEDALNPDDLSGLKKIKQAELATHANERGALMMRRTDALYQTGLVAGTAALSGAAVKSSFDEARELDKQLGNVNSIAQLTTEQLVELKRTLNELSREKFVTESASQLAAGLYDIYSSGFQGRAALEALRIASVGATAGLSDTKTSVEALVGIANAYNMKTGPEMQQIMDMLFKTVDKGVVTFPELASSIGPLIGIASQYKVPIEELGAAISTMTLQGIKADVAITDIKNLIMEIAEPSEKASAAAKSMGLAWMDTVNGAKHLRQVGLAGAVNEITEAAHKSKRELSELFTDVRPLTAIASLSTQSGQLFGSMLQAQRNAAGATEEAVSQQARTVDFQVKKLLAVWAEVKDTFAEPIMLPGAFAALRDLLTVAADSPNLVSLAGGLTAVAAGVTTLGTAITGLAFAKTIVDQVGGLTLMSRGLGAALAVLASPVTLVTAGLVAMGGAAYVVHKQQELNTEASIADARALEEQKSKVNSLVKQYDLLSKELKSGKLNADEAKAAQERLKNIHDDLISISPSFQTALGREANQMLESSKAAREYNKDLDDQIKLKRLSAGTSTPQQLQNKLAEAKNERALLKEDYADQVAVAEGRLKSHEADARYTKRHPGERVEHTWGDLLKIVSGDATPQQLAADRAISMSKALAKLDTQVADLEANKKSDERPNRLAAAGISHSQQQKISPEILDKFDQLLEKVPGARVTPRSIDGQHNAGSHHYVDPKTGRRAEALDIWDFQGKDQNALIAAAQAVGLSVRDERKRPTGQTKWGGPHVHVSLDMAESNTGQAGASSHRTTAGDAKIVADESLASMMNMPMDELAKHASLIQYRRQLQGDIDKGYLQEDGKGGYAVTPGTPKDHATRIEGMLARAKIAAAKEMKRNSQQDKRDENEAVMKAYQDAQKELAEQEERRMAGLLDEDAASFNGMLDFAEQVRAKYGKIGGDKVAVLLANFRRKYISQRGEEKFQRTLEGIDNRIAGEGLPAGERLRLLMGARGESQDYSYQDKLTDEIGKERSKLGLANKQFVMKAPAEAARLKAEGTLNQVDRADFEYKSSIESADRVYKDQESSLLGQLDATKKIVQDKIRSFNDKIAAESNKPSPNRQVLDNLKHNLEIYTKGSQSEIDKVSAVVDAGMRAAVDQYNLATKNAEQKKAETLRQLKLQLDKDMRSDVLAIQKDQVERSGIFGNRMGLIDATEQNALRDLAIDVQEKDKTGVFGGENDAEREAKREAYRGNKTKLINNEATKQRVETTLDYINTGASAFLAVLDKIGQKFTELGDPTVQANIDNYKEFAGVAANVGRVMAGDMTAVVGLVGTAVDKLGTAVANLSAAAAGKLNDFSAMANVKDAASFGGIMYDVSNVLEDWFTHAILPPLGAYLESGDYYSKRTTGQSVRNDKALGDAFATRDQVRNAEDLVHRTALAGGMSPNEVLQAEQQLQQQRIVGVQKALAAVEKGSKREQQIQQELAAAVKEAYAVTIQAIYTEAQTTIARAKMGGGTVTDIENAKINEQTGYGNAAADRVSTYRPLVDMLNEKAPGMGDMWLGAMGLKDQYYKDQDTAKTSYAQADKMRRNAPVAQAQRDYGVSTMMYQGGAISLNQMQQANLGVVQANLDKYKGMLSNPNAAMTPEEKAIAEQAVIGLTKQMQTMTNRYYSTSTEGRRTATDTYFATVDTPFSSQADKRLYRTQRASVNAGLAYGDMEQAKADNDLPKYMAAQQSYYQSLNEVRQTYYDNWKEDIEDTLRGVKATNDSLLAQLDIQEMQKARLGKNVTAADMKQRLALTQQNMLVEGRAIQAKLTDETISNAERKELEGQLHTLKMQYLDEEDRVREDYQEKWLSNIEKMADRTREGIKALYDTGLIMKNEMDARLNASRLQEGATLQAVLGLDDSYAAGDTRKMSTDQRFATEQQLNGVISDYVKERGDKFSETPHVARLSWEAAIKGITVNIDEYRRITGAAATSTEDTWSTAMTNLAIKFNGLPAAATSSYSAMTSKVNTMLSSLVTSSKSAVDKIIANLNSIPGSITIKTNTTSTSSGVTYTPGGGGSGGAATGSSTGLSSYGAFYTWNGVVTAGPQAGTKVYARGGISGYNRGGISCYDQGGLSAGAFSGAVGGFGNQDSELALLTPGEFVIPTRGQEGFMLLHALRILANQTRMTSDARSSQPIVQLHLDVHDNTFKSKEDADHLVTRIKQEVSGDVLWYNRSY